jgi:hypothetical protein
MTLQTLTKQAYEERIFQFDFSGKMDADATLASAVSVSVANQGYVDGSSALSVSAQSVSGTYLQAMFSGGTSGELYKITAKVIDSTGQKLELDGFLRVQDE